MNFSNHPIFVVLRVISFLIVMSSLLVQPVMKSSGLLDKFDIEFAAIDFDEDSNEQENQEEENNMEEIELQLSSFDFTTLTISVNRRIYSASLHAFSFSIKKHLPPPEVLG